MFGSNSNKYCKLVGLSLPVMLPLALAINHLPGSYGRISFTVYSVLIVYFCALFVRNAEFYPVEFTSAEIERIYLILKTNFADIVFSPEVNNAQNLEAQRIYDEAMDGILSFSRIQKSCENKRLSGMRSIQSALRLSVTSLCALLIFIAFPARHFTFYSTKALVWLFITVVCCAVAFMFGSTLKPKTFNVYKQGKLADFFIEHLVDYYKIDGKKPSDKRLSHRYFGSEINLFVYKSREELTSIEAAQLVRLTRNIIKKPCSPGGLYDEFNEILYYVPLFAIISIVSSVVFNLFRYA